MEPALGPPPGLRPAHLLSHLLGLPSLNTRRGREDGWAFLFTVTFTVTPVLSAVTGCRTLLSTFLSRRFTLLRTGGGWR